MATFHNYEDLLRGNYRAQPVRKYKRRQYYRVPVKVLLNNSVKCATEQVLIYSVVAPNAAEAANHIADLFRGRPETEVRAYGPRGGCEYRYVGYTSAITHNLLHGDHSQLCLEVR